MNPATTGTYKVGKLYTSRNKEYLPILVQCYEYEGAAVSTITTVAVITPVGYKVADEDKANAEKICKAVNSHDELLGACKQALEYRKITHHGDDKCIALLQAAIQKAEQ